MTARRWSAQQAMLGLAGAAACLLAFLVVARRAGDLDAPSVFMAVAVLAAVPSLAYVAVLTHPVWLLSLGLVLASISGNWGQLGLPALVAPDRLLIAAALVAIVIRALRSREKISLRPKAVHVALGLTVAYVLASAIAVGTIDDKDAIFRFVDRVGVVPFVVFLLAPLVFTGARQREVLLGALVAFGGYLGLTALFETVGPKALVIPHYILDENYGTHADRARGPFVEAVSNGFALYACLVAAVVALITWKRPWARMAAGAVVLLCALGVIFTLTRSVWIGAVAASVIVLVAARETRRFALPVVLAGTFFVGSALAFIPDLSFKANERAENQRPIWDRENLNRAAVNMIEDKPLLGFGWERFQADNLEYFEQADNYPLTRTREVEIHNAFLSNATELGLVGTTLWVAALVLGVGGALLIRGPPELRPWRLGLAAIAICWAVLASAVYPGAFQPLLLWTWAGVLWAAGPRQPPEQAG